MTLTPDLLISALDTVRAMGIVPGLAFDKDDETSQSFVEGIVSFQRWINANAVAGAGAAIRVDGVLDMDSVKILVRVSKYTPAECQASRERLQS